MGSFGKGRIRQEVSVGIVLVTMTVVGVAHGADPSAEEMVRQWIQWSETPLELDRPLTYQTEGVQDSRGDKQVSSFLLFSRERHGCLLEKRNQSDADWKYAYLFNPSYFASIEKSENGRWFFNEIIEKSNPEYSRARNPGVFVKREAWDGIDLSYFEWSHDAESRLIRGEVPASYIESLPEGTPFNKDVTVLVREESPHWPIEFSYTSGVGSRITKRIEGWHQIGDDWMFTSVHEIWSHPDVGQRERTPISLTGWSEEPFDTDRCYLSYYGLPEPEGMDRPNWWVWIALAVVLAIVGGLLVKRVRG